MRVGSETAAVVRRGNGEIKGSTAKVLVPGTFISFLLQFLSVVLLLSVGCSRSELPTREPSSNPLYRPPSLHDFSKNPQLLGRILASPHGYFRFINIPFGAYVCREFDSTLRSPALNLHGDAHVEQYAVTDVGRGLTDFDDSSAGPAYIDLMRFGTSILLACRENDWATHSEALLDAFLDAYRRAMLDPTARAPEPEVVRRIRSGFQTDPEEYYRYVESVTDPVPLPEQQGLLDAMEPYIRTTVAANTGLSESFFEVKEVGYLKLGIGSALDRKYLVRLDGPSQSSADDVFLELKEVRDLEGINCVSAEVGDPFRILLSHSRIAYQPYRFLGYVRFDGTVFWTHSWVMNYRELDIQRSFRDHSELRDVVLDVGIQLGLGHPKLIASPFDQDLRRDVARLVDRDRDQLKIGCRGLEEKVVEAWIDFQEAAQHQELTGSH